MRNIVLLGASGSIGTQTLQIIKENPSAFFLIGISVNKNISALKNILNEFPSVRYVSIGDNTKLGELKGEYPNVSFYYGHDSLETLATLKGADLIVNALVGFVGLRPTIAAINAKKDVALANKETLVCAGKLIFNLVRQNHVHLYPIDSEHSAIMQCLTGEKKKEVKRLIITASGGPFREYSTKELENVTIDTALKHPTWKMGPKISCDSATLVNKGLEVIEAHYLFNMPYRKISVVIHPESIVHSMVEFIDGSIKAQMGATSMLVPIQYALSGMHHGCDTNTNLSFSQSLNLHFYPLDYKRFEAVKLAILCGKKEKGYPIVYNGANEIAVNQFLEGKLAFNQIVKVIKNTINEYTPKNILSIDDILEVDAWARKQALVQCHLLGGY